MCPRQNIGDGLRRPCLEDLKRNKENVNGFICAVASLPSQRYTFGEFELLALPSRRARHRWQIFEPPCACGKNLFVGLERPCRRQACGGMLGAMAQAALRVRHKTSAWAFGGTAGGKCVPACYGTAMARIALARHAVEDF
jgi:hypothetical protein